MDRVRQCAGRIAARISGTTKVGEAVGVAAGVKMGVSDAARRCASIAAAANGSSDGMSDDAGVEGAREDEVAVKRGRADEGIVRGTNIFASGTVQSRSMMTEVAVLGI